MANESGAFHGRDSAAVQFMVLDILQTLLVTSETPANRGSHLAQQVRELVGARIVAILRPSEDARGHGHALIALEPARHRTPGTLAVLEALAQRFHEVEVPALWEGLDMPEAIRAILEPAGFNGAMVVPLRVGARTIGLMVVLHLLDMQRHAETLRVLEILAPVAALVVQNTLLFETQEAVIHARTRDLQSSERHFHTLAQVAPVGILHMGLQGEVLFVNARWRQLTGHGVPPPGHPAPMQVHADDQAEVVRRWAELRRFGTSFQSEFRIETPEGDTRWVFGEMVAERDEGGAITGFIGSLLDITERKQGEEDKARLQAQLQQSQKMESLGTLAGGVAHDMNNVLGAILGLASANVAVLPAGSPTHLAFQTILTAAERGGKMIKSLLSFARQHPAEERVLDFNELVREEVHLLERTTLAKVRLVLDLDERLRPIRGDASALTHALMNLCVNAVDAMEGQGTLTLRTRNTESGWMELSVVDTGAGMSPDILAKALDPFFTTKEVGKGTGLGLSMVYSTVKAHQGQMEIQSEVGQGTCVRLRFPTTTPEAEAPQASPLQPPQGTALSVLLVDDDELIQSSMLAILDLLGHRATAVSSGEAALAKLDSGFQPHVVILDMNMPGLGGTGTLPRIRALRPTLPIFLATGRVDQAALNLAGAHAHVTLLSKPFTVEELQRQLAELI